MARAVVFFCLLLVVVVVAAKKRKPPAIAGRIVGGTETDISEVPYTVSLRFHRKHECGGSIIGHEYILTAAHCVQKGIESEYTIRVGSKYHAHGGVIVGVKKIKTHDRYDVPTADNDIAILTLRKSLKYNENVTAIELAVKEPEAGEQVLVSGWGAHKENGTAESSLSSVNITVVDRETCKKIYKDFSPITQNMFCAGETEGGKDACNGDSGGPAVVNGRLAGIVSWGNGCGRKNTPGVYTNIVKYLKWIRNGTPSKRKH